MHFPIRVRFGFLFSAVFVSLALVAGCGGDDDDDPNGQASPTGETPTATATVSFVGIVGEGSSPVEAIGTVLTYDGLEGRFLDTSVTIECLLADVLETPGVTARAFLGQFCMTFINITSTRGGITIVEDMRDGGVWEFELSVDDRHWKVENIEKVSDDS